MGVSKNKGITLIALVITIIILMIITGIIISIASSRNGLFQQAWQAKKDAHIGQITDALNLYGVNAQANKQGDIDIDDYLSYIQTKGDYSVQIEDTEDNTEKSKYILVDDMYEYLVEETGSHDIIITYQGTVNEIDGIKLSSYYGEYTYPESGSFRIIKNVTEGELSVTSSNDEIATASIDGKIVTVTPGTLAGEAELTIKAAATGKYEEKTVKYTAKVENGTLIVTAEEYKGIYDTTGHGITVTAIPSAAMIEYSTDGENFTGENPLFTDVGDYTVYYVVSLPGYKTVSASKTVSIGKNEDTSGILAISETAGTITFPETKTFNVTKNISNGVLNVESSDTNIVKASISGNTITLTPEPINTEGTATITVISRETRNYKEARVNYTITVKQGTIIVNAFEYEGTYDGEGHGITVTADPDDATIMYSENGLNYNLDISPRYTDASTYTTYYKVSKPGYKTVSGSKTVTIGRANSMLQLSAVSGVITFPDTGSFTVTKNVGGGALSVTSSDTNVATASVSGNTITINPAPINTESEAVITVKSAQTTNYNEQTANYTITVKQGTIIVTAAEYDGIYDGTGHGITVTANPSGCTIKYSEDGLTYNLDNPPRYTDASTHTTFYKVTRPGYKTVSGSKTVTIGRANSVLQLSASSGTITFPDTGSFTVTKNVSGGALSVSSSNSNVATANIDGTTVTITPAPINTESTATITVTSAQTTNYNTQIVNYNLTVKQGTIIVTASEYDGTYDGTGHGITVTASPADSTIKYSEDGLTYNLDNPPRYVDASSHTTFYKVTKPGYKTVSGSKTVTIGRATSTLQLSAVSGTITFPDTGVFTVTRNVSGGTLSVSSSNSNVATASIDGTTVTINPAPINTESSAILTIKSAQTNNYNEQTATYNITVKQGTITVTAEEYNGIYDGSGHGITVVASPAGCTIKYSENGTNYNLDNPPRYTDASTHTTYYKVTKAGYKTVSGSKTVTIGRANSTLQLSETTGSITYPGTKAISVTRNVSGGTLSVSSTNNNIASATVSGTTVTVTAGTTAGEATITVKSAETINYKEQTATYKVTVANGTIQVTASEYNGTYDGSGHGITVTTNPTGCTIKYSENGTEYNLDNPPRYTDASTHTTYYKVSKAGYKTVSGSKTVTIGRASNTLQLSATSGSITYPATGTFTITKNTSGGTLSVSTSNSNIATAAISGTTVTITPGTTAGEATLTITSAQTNNYNVQTATYKVTVIQGTIQVTANEYNGTYDGSGHGITVTAVPSDATIVYSEDGLTYNLNNPPRYTDASTHTTYYKVSKAGYKTVSGSKTVTIGRANSVLQLSETTGSTTYPSPKAFTITRNVSGGALTITSSNSNIATVTRDGNNVTINPGTTSGEATITIKSAQTTNYNEQTVTYKITVAVGTIEVTASDYNAGYDGKAHGITVTTNPTGCTIKYSTDGTNYNLDSSPTYTDASTHTVYYKVSKAGYKTVSGSKTVTITSINNTLTLSASSGSITYPGTTTFTITKNTGGGALSVASSNNNIATASISGTTVTVTAGTTAGEANITVTSAATTNYNKQTAIYKATVANGTITVTASDYSGGYDGKAHGITVTTNPTGCTIKYSTDGTNYNLDSSPTYTDVSTHTVYYKVSKAGYKTVAGSKTITITRINSTLTLSETTKTVTYPTAGTITVTKNVSGGTISATSSNTNAATVSVSGTTVTITPKAISSDSTTTITVKSAATTNYNEQTATCAVTVKQGTITVTANNYNAGYDGSAHGISVSVSPSDATIAYSTDGTNYNLTSSPTYTDAGTHTVYYKASKAGYKTVSGSKTVTITSINNTLTLSETTKTITYPTAGTITVTKNLSGGTLSATSSNTDAATVSVSGTTVTITPKAISSDSSATITVKSAATTNYNEKTATCAVTVKQGTITVTASNYSGYYDGNAHGITVTASPSDATIAYSTDGTNYNLTSAPTYTTASTNTTYYKVTKAGYKTVTGSKTVTINKYADSQAPQAATITLGGSGTKSSLPTTVTATVTHTDTAATNTYNSSGIAIGSCKYILNTSSTALGTNASSYTGGTFSSNGQTLSLSISSTGSYYLHVLSVDGSGNAKETIKGPINITANYHSHTGSSSSGGGCYGTANYHSHVSSCYTTTYHYHTGSSSSGGGCYGTANYSTGSDYRNCPYGYTHSHTGNSTSGGGCYGSASTSYANCPYGYTHSHTGSSTSGGGCYGKANYHSHVSSCYHSHTSSCSSTLHESYKSHNQWHCNDCGRYKYYEVGTDYTNKKCNQCNNSGSGRTSGYQGLTGYKWSCYYCSKTATNKGFSGTTGCVSHFTCGKSTSTLVCGKSTSTVESYSLNCGKTAHSHTTSCQKTTYSLNCGKTAHSHTSSCVYSWNYISSYSLNCGYSNGQATGSYISCGKTTSTIESYSLSCGKSTSTIVSYTVSY